MNINKIRNFTATMIIAAILLTLIIYAVTNSDFNFSGKKFDQNPKTGLGYVRVGRVEYKARDIFLLGDFTANMAKDDHSGKFVRVEVRLKMSDEDLKHELKDKNILLRDAVIEELSLKHFSDISTEKGKMKLKKNLKNRLNKIVDDGDIEEVFFTKFIVQ